MSKTNKHCGSYRTDRIADCKPACGNAERPAPPLRWEITYRYNHRRRRNDCCTTCLQDSAQENHPIGLRSQSNQRADTEKKQLECDQVF